MSPIHTSFRLAAVLAVMSVTFLGGCSSTMTQAYLHRSGVPNSFAYAAGARDMTVVVVGNPFAVPKGELDRFVADAMQGRNHGPVTHFTTTPGDSARPGYRIVVALNTPMAFDAHDACGDVGTIPAAPPTERLRAVMAFCAKDTILSEVTGSVPHTLRPGDGKFGELIGAMTWELVPVDDPDSGDNNMLIVRARQPDGRS
jgi:hypothetical protein